MNGAVKRRTILAIVRTDATFSLTTVRGERLWVGKCIHCRARLVINEAGEPASHATVEHIEPRTHGGTEDLVNLALACRRCNHAKGKQLDVLGRDDPRRSEVVERLRAVRLARWREPLTTEEERPIARAVRR